ncbi:MAG: zinc-binding dehydrogenase [Betaproteobacteria bacterium]|nr:zinc-binding dehydrogenase [Betaproteobacteria bacterium]
MKAGYIVTEGSAARIEVREAPIPEPKTNEVLVRVRASSMNRGELFVGVGAYGRGASGARPAGSEAAGEVERLGEGVAGFTPGERVMGRCKGGFAEHALFDARELMRVPDRLSWEEAASIPIVFLVAYDMLVVNGRLRPGEWVLITAATSGVGVACVQIVKALGARSIGTSGSEAKLARLRALGVDVGVRTREGNFVEEVMRATDGRGADLVVNNVGGSVFPACQAVLGYRGRFATVGYVDGVMRTELDIEALHTKRQHFFGVSNRLRTAEERAETVRGFVADLLPTIGAGAIRPVIERVFDLDDLPAAKQYMESNAHLGKIAVRVA